MQAANYEDRVKSSPRIREIEVSKLFGFFNHKIRMNEAERITIIQGPNGYGKTAILRLLDALFNDKDAVLKKIPFNEFRVTFDNDSFISVKQSENRKERRDKVEHFLKFEYRDSEGTTDKFITTPVDRVMAERLYGVVEDVIPFLTRIARDTWKNDRSGEILSIEEIVDRFEDDFPPSMIRGKHEAPGALLELRKSIPLRFIEAQRLIAIRPRSHQPRRPFDSTVPIYAAEEYSEELAKEIKSKLAEYATLSQSLDHSFPTRIFQEGNRIVRTEESIRNQYLANENKRNRLMEAGLLGKEGEYTVPLQQGFDERTKDLLGVYVEDVAKKLGVFDGILEKIELLKRAINSKFLFKELSIDKERGYVIITKQGRELRPTDLSSGEQHEIVLNHELLFKATPNSLILMDEPELSFHVAWQESFLKDLAEIARLAELDVLLATHSPHIIFDKWDLTVELKAPQDVGKS